MVYQELSRERLNTCGAEQMQEKRVSREVCGVEGYKEWTIEIIHVIWCTMKSPFYTVFKGSFISYKQIQGVVRAWVVPDSF